MIGLDVNQLDVAKEGLAGILIFYIILDVGSHLSMYAVGESLRRILSISGIFLAVSFVLMLIYDQLFDKSTAQSTFAVIWIGSLAASLFASWKLYHRMLEHSSLIQGRDIDLERTVSLSTKADNNCVTLQLVSHKSKFDVDSPFDLF